MTSLYSASSIIYAPAVAEGENKLSKSLMLSELTMQSFGFNMQSYLFVHEDVDDWVVDGSCLGKEGGDGSQPGVKFNCWMSCDQDREDCIWCPTHHECNNHHHHHTGHLPLWLLGIGQSPMRYLKNKELCTLLSFINEYFP